MSWINPFFEGLTIQILIGHDPKCSVFEFKKPLSQGTQYLSF
jgi:hypothetical protein